MSKPFPANLPTRFEEAFHTEPDFLVRAPGRVDLIGTHTDYNDGWVLPTAITRSVWLAVKAMPTAMVTLNALDLNGEVVFRLTDLSSKRDLTRQPLPTWAQYAAGVAWSLQEAKLATPGTKIAITSNIPIGAGVSSSGAITVAYATAWSYVTGWDIDKMKLAQLCQRAENDYVGVNSGLMDQFASLFGQAGHALLFDCRTLEWEQVPLPDTAALVVADTSTRRELAHSAYNERRASCEEAVAVLKKHLPGIEALRDVSLEDFKRYKQAIPEPARQRAEHIINENKRVCEAAEALRQGDVEQLGVLMDASQISSRDLYEASGPALDAMWEASQGHPARLGGRFIGAGWAGCLVFLVRADGADEFVAHTARRFQEKTNLTPNLYVTQTADGAEVLHEWKRAQ